MIWFNEPFVNMNSNDITSNISDVCTECVSKTVPLTWNATLESESYNDCTNQYQSYQLNLKP